MCKVFKKQVSSFPSAKQSAGRPNIRIKVVISGKYKNLNKITKI